MSLELNLKWNDQMLDNGCLEIREWILMLRIEFRAMIVFLAYLLEKVQLMTKSLIIN